MQYTAYLRWGVISALFLVLLTPFVVADGGSSHGLYIPFVNLFFPFITGKNFLFRIFIEIALAGYIILALRDPRYRPRPSLIMWAALALVVWMALATGLSVDPVKSLWSNFERMDGYITMLHLFAWFVMTGAVLSAEALWERFFEYSVALSGIMGFDALMQLLGWIPISSQSGARVDTTFGNATYLAVYMLFNIFILLYILARRWGEKRLTTSFQIYYGLVLVLQFLALYHTQTRGAQLGALGGLVIAGAWIAFFGRAREYKVLRQGSLAALGVIAVLALGFFAARNSSFIAHSPTLSRLASLSLNDSTIAARIKYIWPTALKGIAEKPVVGWGQENFSYVFNEHYQPAMYNQEAWFDRAHNQFLDFGIAGGVPALLLYVALFALAAWALWRSALSVPQQAVLLGLLGGYAVNNLAVFDNLVSFFYFFAILAFLHSVSRKELPGWMFLARPLSERGIAIAAPVVLVALAFGGWALNAPGMARASTIVKALSQQSSPQQNYDYFNAALTAGPWPGTPLGYQETTEQLGQFTASNVASASIDQSIKSQYLALATDSLQKIMTERKHDARLELFMGTLLSQFGALDQALTYLKQAQQDSPQKQQILMQIGLVDIQMGNLTDAEAVLKQAFESAPEYDTARILYAGAYYYAGDIKSGDAVIAERFGSPIVDDDQLLSIFTNTKQWARAEAVWQLRIDKSPNDAQGYLGLASVYFASGDKAHTIAQLQKVGQLQPSLAAQMQTLITQIENGTLKP